MSKLKIEIWKDAFKQEKGAYPLYTSVYLKCSYPKPKNRYYAVWSNFINNFKNGYLVAFQPSEPIYRKGKMIIDELLFGKTGYRREFNLVKKEIDESICLCAEAREKKLTTLDLWWPKTQKALSCSGNILFPFDLAFEKFLKELRNTNEKEYEIVNNHIKNNKASFLDEVNRTLISLEKRHKNNFAKVFDNFEKDFGWFQNTYKGPFKIDKRWLKKYFKKIRSKRKTRRVIKEKSRTLPNKYKIIISLTNEAIVFRDDKKRLLLLAVDLIDMWLKNLCKQNCWKYKVMRWLTADEIIEMVKKGEKGNLIMAEQCNKNNQRIGIMTSMGYKNVSQKLWEEVSEFHKHSSNANEVKGVVANKGICQGKIKIISDPRKEASRFREGDILVASNTRPEFFPLMNKACAFITDEGGLSCHAAIVAREMNKPCIIGTKIATKVLKDGDLAEVDADKGVVKIIKKIK